MAAMRLLHRARQAWRLFGWGRPGGDLWGNVVEQEQFSSSGRRLAVVIWVHYISKVQPCSLPSLLSWGLRGPRLA